MASHAGLSGRASPSANPVSPAEDAMRVVYATFSTVGQHWAERGLPKGRYHQAWIEFGYIAR